jgi:DNA integrity scanning protein DisA with diadenylate cyclase activity
MTGTPDDPVPIAESGGTRHQSALRFVLAHHEAVALVVSQDRHLSIAYWSPIFSSLTMLRNAEWFA